MQFPPWSPRGTRLMREGTGPVGGRAGQRQLKREGRENQARLRATEPRASGGRRAQDYIYRGGHYEIAGQETNMARRPSLCRRKPKPMNRQEKAGLRDRWRVGPSGKLRIFNHGGRSAAGLKLLSSAGAAYHGLRGGGNYQRGAGQAQHGLGAQAHWLVRALAGAPSRALGGRPSRGHSPVSKTTTSTKHSPPPPSP